MDVPIRITPADCRAARRHSCHANPLSLAYARATGGGLLLVSRRALEVVRRARSGELARFQIAPPPAVLEWLVRFDHNLPTGGLLDCSLAVPDEYLPGGDRE